MIGEGLRERFLAISSREQAFRIIRRASYYFILTALILLVLQGFSIHDEWIAARGHAGGGSWLGDIAGSLRFFATRIVSEDWVYLLVLANGIVLRRFASRVAAALFVVFGLYGMTLSLFVLWAIGRDALLVSGFLTLFFGSYVVVASRAFTAAKKLHGEFRYDKDAPAQAGGDAPDP